FHLPGLIDEAALYNRALTSQEILQHYLAATVLSGDYNGDGVVDLADYVVWRNHLNSATVLPGDATPGSVTAVDYQWWWNNYGSRVEGDSGAQHVVPEPSLKYWIVLAVLGLSFIQYRTVVAEISKLTS